MLVCFLLAQVTLGAFVIWSAKDIAINTAHVACGALTLATSLVLTLRSYRVRFEGAARRCRARPPAGAANAGTVGSPRMKKGVGCNFGGVHGEITPDPFFGRGPPAFGDFLALTKPRLNSLVIVTAAIGYYLGAGDVAEHDEAGSRRSPASRWWRAERRA